MNSNHTNIHSIDEVPFALGTKALDEQQIHQHLRPLFSRSLKNSQDETFARNTAKQLIINRTHPVK